MIMMNFASLQEEWSPQMSFINQFNDHAMTVVVMVISLVVYLYGVFFQFSGGLRFMSSHETLETVWTLLPSIILASLATPSLMTLYVLDEGVNPSLSVKVTGHQWYWSYEVEKEEEYESYMTPSGELSEGDLRLLEVDKSLTLPFGVEARFLVTSGDVIHSWSVPSLGLKVDAVPGRLNQIFSVPSRVGTIYGQCSEICGSLHSFMPIKVEVVLVEDFSKLFN